MRYRLICLFILLSAFCLNGQAKKEKRAVVELQTSAGVIRVALFDETPIHTANFLKLVSEGYYNGLLFHRVIKDFMIQGGDPDSKNAPRDKVLGEGGLPYTLEPEFMTPLLYHHRGALAMAREGDDENPERRSSSTQFYIVWGKTFSQRQLQSIRQKVSERTGGEAEFSPEMCDDYELRGGTPHLDGQYTVFGEVIEGLDVVKKIQLRATDANDRPLEDVVVIKTIVLQESQAKKKRTDEIAPHRYTSHTWSLGIGGTRVLETYLSPTNFSGLSLGAIYETFRASRWLPEHLTTQQIWQLSYAKTTNQAGLTKMYTGLLSASFGLHYRWNIGEHLTLFAGGQNHTALGVVYNNRNGNNPAQAKAQTTLGASGICLYKDHLGRMPFTLRYQLDFPLVGIAFSPQYGQSYYELFERGNYDHNVCFVYPGNAPSWRSLLSLDLPVKNSLIRVGYLMDIRQSRLNNLKSHTYDHQFTIGVVRHLTRIKRRDAAFKHFIY